MKKALLVSAVVAIALITLGVAGFVFAQTETPPTPAYQGYGPGMMGGRGGYGWMMGESDTEEPPMHELMVASYAKALGLSAEELEARLDNGETMWQVAQSLGLSEEQFAAKWQEAHREALTQAVSQGLITQSQADWMSQRMTQRFSNGFTPGSDACGGHMFNGQGRGFGRGWQAQP
jgi:hypothetical protein